ncbi:hypothetical protein ACIQB5_41780 [Streptomyces sp. NPDC088560]|uniref:hypothetical protein n=1 Tax=Streptomyces sp. NPDC088560 TaxID=3365868 RepID=UPI0038226289
MQAVLRLLTAHRADLIADRVRLINRLRDVLMGICPALERAFDYSAAKGPIVMLTKYQTPAALRRIVVERLNTWLERGKVRGAVTSPPSLWRPPVAGDRAAWRETNREAGLRPAHQLLALDERIKGTDRGICETFRLDWRAEIIESLPGM